MDCFNCGRILKEIPDTSRENRKKFESFIIAGEQKPPDASFYVFWIDPDTGEPLRPRVERACERCGFTYDIYHWAPREE